jgi:hypothetical protein
MEIPQPPGVSLPGKLRFEGISGIVLARRSLLLPPLPDACEPPEIPLLPEARVENKSSLEGKSPSKESRFCAGRAIPKAKA